METIMKYSIMWNDKTAVFRPSYERGRFQHEGDNDLRQKLLVEYKR